MPGLDPGIHAVLTPFEPQSHLADGRVKPGHDE
jgi:hypothetical protein